MFPARRRDMPPTYARAAWYDRNPSSLAQSWWEVGVAPHIAAKRTSFTCPSQKKAMVELLQVEVFRRTVATTVGNARAIFYLRPLGGTAIPILLARIATNDIKDKDSVSLGATLTLFASDILEGWTNDDSNGGTCDYKLHVKITEFDA